MDQQELSRQINVAFLNYEVWTDENPQGGIEAFICERDLPTSVADQLRRTVGDKADVQGLFETPDSDGVRARIDGSSFTETRPSIEGFDIVEKLGAGGMGTVWLVNQHEPVGRRVAINTTPLTMDFFRRSSPIVLLQAIRDVPTPFPSVRLSKTDDAREWVEQQTASSYSSWKNKLQKDLDWVVAKSLEKDRERRYSSVAELAQDVGRFVAGEPVSAKQPSITYRTRKWVGRNRVLSIASVLVLAMLVGLGIFYGAMTNRARVAEGSAAIESELSKQHRQEWLDSISQNDPSLMSVEYHSEQKDTLLRMLENLDNGRFETFPMNVAVGRIQIGDALSKNWDTGMGIEQIMKGRKIIEEAEGIDSINAFNTSPTLADAYLRAGQMEKVIELTNRMLDLPARKLADPVIVFWLMSTRNKALRLTSPPEKGLGLAKELLKQAEDLGIDETGRFWVEAKAAYPEALMRLKRYSEAATEFQEVTRLCVAANQSGSARFCELINCAMECDIEVGSPFPNEDILQTLIDRSAKKFGPSHRLTEELRALLQKKITKSGMEP